jgi:hypothetical protein
VFHGRAVEYVSKALQSWLPLVLLLTAGCSASQVSGPTSPVSTTVTTSIETTAVATETTTTVSAGGMLDLIGVDPLPPITGYGDYSDVDFYDLDVFEVTEAEVACLHDHGFPVTIIPPGDGISFQGISPEQNGEAAATLEACMAGLNLPPYHPPSREVMERQYQQVLELAECLRQEGYDIPQAPSEETWIESWSTGTWSPYNDLALPTGQAGQDEWDRLNVACPQQTRPDAND